MYYLSILVTLQTIFCLTNPQLHSSFVVKDLKKSLINSFYSNYPNFNDNYYDTVDPDLEKCRCIPQSQCDKYFNKITTNKCSNSNEICCPLSEEINTCGDSKISYIDLITPRTQAHSGIESGEYPWMTAILQKLFYEDHSYIFLCGGSVIHPRIILTATHCLKLLEAIDLKVRAGITKLYEYEDSAQERNVIEIIRHPSYFSGGLFNDISLLVLETPFVINQAIDIICLPNHETQFKKSNCLATGWGSNSANERKIVNSMNKVLLDIVPKRKCEQQLKNYLSQNFRLHDSFLCAIGNYGQDTCTGDGGGPLICSVPNSSKWYQVGIVSWGLSCGVPYIPGVYTDVSQFIEWIQQQIKRF